MFMAGCRLCGHDSPQQQPETDSRNGVGDTIQRGRLPPSFQIKAPVYTEFPPTSTHTVRKKKKPNSLHKTSTRRNVRITCEGVSSCRCQMIHWKRSVTQCNTHSENKPLTRLNFLFSRTAQLVSIVFHTKHEWSMNERAGCSWGTMTEQWNTQSALNQQMNPDTGFLLQCQSPPTRILVWAGVGVQTFIYPGRVLSSSLAIFMATPFFTFPPGSCSHQFLWLKKVLRCLSDAVWRSLTFRWFDHI